MKPQRTRHIHRQDASCPPPAHRGSSGPAGPCGRDRHPQPGDPQLCPVRSVRRGSGDIIVVDKDATGAETGESWEDAFTKLQDALDIAAGAEIWVAEGVYYPDEGTGQTDGDRTATFQLKQGVTIYGGFDGTENLARGTRLGEQRHRAQR